MPNYKKKRRSMLFGAPKRKKSPPRQRAVQDDIKMSPSKPKKNKNQEASSFKVVKGKKCNGFKKFKSLLSVTAAVVVIALVLETIFPAGVFQSISNLTAVFGTGAYPIAISGSQTLDTVSLGNYYFVLTDTHITAVSNAGKELLSEAHGFEKPILCSSRGRVLLYGQGGKQALIYDLRERKATINTENEIICAAISDSGCYSIATYSDKYASQITVYNKRNTQIYEWYSAKETINNAVLSVKGNKLAISTFNYDSGVLNSRVNLLGFKDATPESSMTFEKTLIYGLKSGNNRGFFVIKSNGTDFIRWSKANAISYNEEYSISHFRKGSSLSLAVFSRESDKTDNKIVVLNRKGDAKYTIQFKGIINDIQIKGSNIYCLSDTQVSVLDFEGEIKFTADCEYGGIGLAVLSSNTVAVVSDNEIIKIKLN